MPGVTRRSFLAGSAAVGFGLAGRAFSDDRPMPMRELGKTGVKVSLAGLGCYQLGRGKVKDADAAAIVHRAIDLGITYIDSAYSYGQSERRLGLALGKRREKIFLTTKTLPRTEKGAMTELETSLKRLKTDRVDLWQFHALRTSSDIDALAAAKGALRAGEKAVQQGKVRFLGITGHYRPDVFVEALKRYPFATLLIPLNCVDPWRHSFEERALPSAVDKKTGLIAMKVFGGGALVRGVVEPEACLRYTYGLPISTCIVGCESIAQVELAADVARNFKPMTAEERTALRARTKGHSDVEWYKR